MNFFERKQKVDPKVGQAIFEYFNIEKTAKETLVLGDFANKDFSHWLAFIHGVIQTAMNMKPLEGKAVENYVNITLHIGGQRVDIALVKDGKKSPHELLQELKG